MQERRISETGSGLWPTPRTRGLLGGSGSREMVIAKRKHDNAGLLGFVGGFIIGWQFISTIQEKSSPWEVTAIGVASMIASIPFNSSYSRRAVNAAKLYNGGLKDTSLEYEKLELGITGTGIGLQLSF